MCKTIAASVWILIGAVTAIVIGIILASFTNGTEFEPFKATMKEKGMLAVVIFETVLILLTWASWLALKIYASISISLT